MTGELKPCPFCGGTNVEVQRENLIACTDCGGAVCTEWLGSPADTGPVVAAWNRRTEPTSPEGALSVALSALDRIAQGTWNKGEPERKAARKFAAEVRDMLSSHPPAIGARPTEQSARPREAVIPSEKEA